MGKRKRTGLALRASQPESHRPQLGPHCFLVHVLVVFLAGQARIAHGRGEIGLGPSQSRLNITLSAAETTDLTRIGDGNTGGEPVVASAVSPEPAPTEGPWKFGPAPGTNSRLIVIDPGHGGGDAGAAHNGLVEKNLTFDIAQRLRALLVAQGWTVRMTRDGDVDPVSQANLAKMHADGLPNADDRAYLQTRCDVANDVNARLFISIHINSAPVTSARGTTA